MAESLIQFMNMHTLMVLLTPLVSNMMPTIWSIKVANANQLTFVKIVNHQLAQLDKLVKRIVGQFQPGSIMFPITMELLELPK